MTNQRTTSKVHEQKGLYIVTFVYGAQNQNEVRN